MNCSTLFYLVNYRQNVSANKTPANSELNSTAIKEARSDLAFAIVKSSIRNNQS